MMDEAKWMRLLDYLKAAGHRAEADNIEAKRLTLPEDIPAWLVEAERVSRDFPDAHRERIMELIERARCQHGRREDLLLKTTVKQIIDTVDDARKVVEIILGLNTRKVQSDKAKKPRGRIRIDGFGEVDEKLTNEGLITLVAFQKDALGDYLGAPELWDELEGELDKLNLNPRKEKPNDPAEKKYIFDGGEIKYTSFKATLSKLQKASKK